jgi:hypothetical protein
VYCSSLLVPLLRTQALLQCSHNPLLTLKEARPFSASLRYQQVYDAIQFVGSGSIKRIAFKRIAFRSDATFGQAFSMTIANIQIDLSTTLATPDALSSTLDVNVGADDTAVYTGSL